MPKSPKRSAYHHGDLRQTLLDAAIAILAETGEWDFSIRELSRRAGVSHNAPYAHFADKSELLAAVAIAGFGTLRARMLKTAAAKKSAADALPAIGLVYCRFGAENPAHYRLMFGPTLMRGDDAAIARVAEAAAASRAVLSDTIARGVREGVFAVADNAEAIAVATIAAWSMAHGLTMLFIDGLTTAETKLGLDRLVGLVGARFSVGIARVSN